MAESKDTIKDAFDEFDSLECRYRKWIVTEEMLQLLRDKNTVGLSDRKKFKGEDVERVEFKSKEQELRCDQKEEEENDLDGQLERLQDTSFCQENQAPDISDIDWKKLLEFLDDVALY
ncbi:unnamed protein product [Hermetia illucens]|uniref:Uncharacterized protein n=1 Tax=Hermetia illucens TaxID=343691 RepID=A0A7R8UMV1_HERIL|nr:unnamed protein product [Hermetia illucens]